MKSLHIFCIALSVAATVSLKSQAEATIGYPGEEASMTGIYIKDLKTGKVLVENDSQKAMTPASTMKLVTTATALSLLDNSFTFDTKCYLTGRCDGDTWVGDIVIKGAADPTLESENFKEYGGVCDSIASHLAERGIKRVTGSILVDDKFSDWGVSPFWEIDDVAYSYGAGLFGLNFRDNYCRVYPATGDTKPVTPGLDIHVSKVAEGTELLRGARSNTLYIESSADINDPKWGVNTTMPCPAESFVYELTETLLRYGIELDCGDTDPTQSTSTLLYTHHSPCLGEILRSLMVRSDNLFAEGMLRAIAPGKSRSDAIKAELDLWNSRDISTDHINITDGSGLARADRLTPKFLAEVLEWMAKSSMSAQYTSFFPCGSKDGTMKTFMAKRPKMACTFALKTGSMNGVQCYAGYRIDKHGKPTHVVVVMINSFFCPRSQVREAVENLLINTF